MPRFRLLHTAIFTLSVLGLPVPVLAQDADLPDNTVASESGEAEQAPEDAGLQQDGGGGDTSSDDGLTAGRADHSADDTETTADPNEDLPVNASAVANQDKCYESFTYANAHDE